MHFPKLLSILLICTFIFCLHTNYSINAKSTKETWKVFSDENVEEEKDEDEDEEEMEFNHLAVDEYGRWVYIGAENHIYQLSADLELKIKYTISKLTFSPHDCTSIKCSHKLKRDAGTFNENEVLVLDYQNQQLISCGTFFSGICHAHDMSNISRILTSWSEPIVESNSRERTIAFIAPSLLQNFSTLYEGIVTSIQTITIKNLGRGHFSSVLTQNTTSDLTGNEYPIAPLDELIYGFSSDNIGFFITANTHTSMNNSVSGYLIVTDIHKKNSWKQIPIICNSGLDGTVITREIKKVYIQKRNRDSDSKTDSHEIEEKIMFTLQIEETEEGDILSVCRYQINKLHSLIQKEKPWIGDFIFSPPLSAVRVTAMVVTSINNYTILFFGTSDGRLLKISIKRFDSPDLYYTASKYADITIDEGSPVHEDMLFDSTQNFLYVMTENKLTRVKIHNCDEYNTSHACLAIKDPHCGWCFPRNRCCLKSECDVEQDRINWVSHDIDKYEIDAPLSPADKFSRTAEWNVSFKLLTCRPFINRTIICLFEFGNFSINTTTVCNKNSITCATPTPNYLPATPIDNHSIEAQLSVQTNNFSTFRTIPIIFYDCSTYGSCSSCMSSPYPCKWYVNGFRCTDDAIWKKDDIVIGMKFSSSMLPQGNGGSLHSGNKFSKNSMFCPQFFTEHKSDIYIPDDTEKTQQIQAYYKLPINLLKGDLTCKFEFSSKKERIQSERFQDYSIILQGDGMNEGELKCNDEIFAYPESKPSITVELSILWNGSKPLDNMYNTHIVVYKCAHMGDQCTACLNKNYSCVWNSETAECKYYSLDDKPNVTDPWLHDMRDCSNSTIFQKILRKKQSTNWFTENIYLIITIILAVTFTVVAVFVIYYRKSAVRSRKMQQQMNKMGMEMIAMSQCVKRVVIENEIELGEKESDILKIPNVTIVYESYPTEDTNEMEPRTEYEAPGSEYELPLDENWEIPRENVVLGEFLGEGQFGRVVKGNVSGLLQPHIVTTAAVKMLKNTHKDTDMVNLVTEMELLKLIGRHDNVLKLLGCCTQNGPLLVIIEYSPHGNLLDFLRNHHQPSKARANDLSEKFQLTFALQIATGMEYLASIKLIHRDLAARNILIFDDYVLKIADFGLAKDIRNADYYKQKTKGRLPVKWMAPETLTHRRHSTQSDVWSYGILLWEIVTFGAVPYATYDDAEKLLQDIGSGYRMKKPENCSMDTYCLMVKCWNHLPENRPNFTRIIHDLEAILKKMDAEIEESDSDCSNISSVSSRKANETNSLLSDTS